MLLAFFLILAGVSTMVLMPHTFLVETCLLLLLSKILLLLTTTIRKQDETKMF